MCRQMQKGKHFVKAEKPKRILLVDDEEIVRDALAGFLACEGYEVDEACSGQEAIERLKKFPFDVVIADIKMPKKNGVDVLIETKKTRPEAEVILITGSIFDQTDKVLDLGAKALIHKSTQVGDFIEKIIRVIEHENPQS